MPPGGEGLNKSDPRVARLMNQQRQMVVSMGQFLGEEVLHVMRGMQRMESDVQIYGGQKTISCPGRERTNAGRAGFEGTYKDGAAGGNPARTAEGRRHCDRRGERGSFQPHRAAIETGVAVYRDDDGDADERIGALRIHPERCRVWDVHVRSSLFAAAAGMRRNIDRERDPRPDLGIEEAMKIRMLFIVIAGLLFGSTVYAQLAEEFNPPRANCCLANTAKSLADQLQDWNQLGRYHQANQQLKNQPADAKRVVFMGDSITDLWRLEEYFPGKALCESRHRRADHASDARADVSRRDRP